VIAFVASGIAFVAYVIAVMASGIAFMAFVCLPLWRMQLPFWPYD
jgi:hypothetical protein